MQSVPIVAGIVGYTITLASAAFAFGAIWAKKQDKTVCKEEHSRLTNSFQETIESLKKSVHLIEVRLGVLGTMLETIEKQMALESRIQSKLERMETLIKG